MHTFNSNKRIVSKQPGEVFAFLSNLNNWEKLMPENVENWESTGETCRFEIKGTGNLGLRIIEQKEPEYIRLDDNGKAPIKYTFHVYISPLDGQSEIFFTIDAETNAFTRMIIERPLTNFLNMLVEKVEQSV